MTPCLSLIHVCGLYQDVCRVGTKKQRVKKCQRDMVEMVNVFVLLCFMSVMSSVAQIACTVGAGQIWVTALFSLLQSQSGCNYHLIH